MAFGTLIPPLSKYFFVVTWRDLCCSGNSSSERVKFQYASDPPAKESVFLVCRR